jgi:hypothetical protein
MATIITEGTPVIFHIEDDEGLHEVDCTVTKANPIRVSPTHWLGEGHHYLDRFTAEFKEYLTSDPDAADTEEWAADWILAATSKLTGDLWACWKQALAE